jgi:hypothetical protein
VHRDGAIVHGRRRRIGIGPALTLADVDLVYVPRPQISRMYLVDAAVEAAWLLARASTFTTRMRRS